MKRGEEVEAKPARPVTVYSLSLQKFQPPFFTLGKMEKSEIVCIYMCLYFIVGYFSVILMDPEDIGNFLKFEFKEG